MQNTINTLCTWLRTISLADLATTASLVFVAWQTILLRKTYQYNCDWQEKEKAAELALMYKDEILPGVSYVSSILKANGIMDILGNIHRDNIDQFNQTELFRLTNQNIKENIEKKENSFDTIDTFLRIRSQFGQIYSKKLHNIDPLLITKWYGVKNGKKDKDGKAIVMTDDEKRKLLKALKFEYTTIVSHTLNSLECFSMNFVSGIADDAVVFQSLHQTYLNVVQLLYYNIAIKNVHEKDKYYTNITELYKKWREKDEKNERMISDAIMKTKPVRK